MITAESRDFRVVTYSLVSFTVMACAICIFTGVGGGPWDGSPFAGLSPHADTKLRSESSDTNNVLFDEPALTDRELRFLMQES
jgi:hypothetical protein